MTETTTQSIKICPRCKEGKTLDHYTKDKATKDGLCSICRACNSIRKKAYCDSPRGKQIMKNYKILHPEVQKKAAKNYREKDPEAWRKRALDASKTEGKKWYANHRKRLGIPGTYLLCEVEEGGLKRRVKAEVLGEFNGMVKVRILSTGKHVLQFKSKLFLGRQRGQSQEFWLST